MALGSDCPRQLSSQDRTYQASGMQQAALCGQVEFGLLIAGAELKYPRAVSAAFRRPTVLPIEVQCGWRSADRGQDLSFGPPNAGLRCMIAQPTSFVVTSQSSGKALVEGCIGSGVVSDAG